MKKFFAFVCLLSFAGSAWAQIGGMGSSSTNKGSIAPPPPKKQASTRTLTGTVLNQDDQALASAVIYLKDTRTLAVRTYISNKDGSYQFGGLAPNQDYELYADYQGDRSSTRTLSAFDSRTQPNINLHVNVKKKQ
jgi:hypothetical protein